MENGESSRNNPAVALVMFELYGRQVITNVNRTEPRPVFSSIDFDTQLRKIINLVLLK